MEESFIILSFSVNFHENSVRPLTLTHHHLISVENIHPHSQPVLFFLLAHQHTRQFSTATHKFTSSLLRTQTHTRPHTHNPQSAPPPPPSPPQGHTMSQSIICAFSNLVSIDPNSPPSTAPSLASATDGTTVGSRSTRPGRGYVVMYKNAHTTIVCIAARSILFAGLSFSLARARSLSL